MAELVVLQVELAQLGQVAEGIARDLLEPVGLQVQDLQLHQAVQRAVADGLDAAVVEEERADPLATDECRALEVVEGVAVEVDEGSVHGDERRHVAVVTVRAV